MKRPNPRFFSVIFAVQRNLVSVWDVEGSLLWEFVPESEILDAKSFVDVNGLSTIALLSETKVYIAQSGKWGSPSLSTHNLDLNIQYNAIHVTQKKRVHISGVLTREEDGESTQSYIIDTLSSVEKPHEGRIIQAFSKNSHMVFARKYALIHGLEGESSSIVIDLDSGKSQGSSLKLASDTFALEDFIVSGNVLLKIKDLKLEKVSIPIHDFTSSLWSDEDGRYFIALVEKEEKQLNVLIYDQDGKQRDQVNLVSGSDASVSHVSFFYQGKADSLTLMVQYNDLLVETFKHKTKLWSKEESLSQVRHSLFFNYPSTIDETPENMIESVTRSLNALKDQLGSIIQDLTSVNLFQEGSIMGIFRKNAAGHAANLKEKERFGLRKVLLVSTRVGKLLAFDTGTSQLLWSKNLNGNIEYLFQLNKHASEALALVNKKGIFHSIYINVLTGEVIQSKALSYDVKNAYQLPLEKDLVQPVLVLSTDKTVHVETNKNIVLSDEDVEKVYLYLIEKESGVVQGFSLGKTSDDFVFTANDRWKIDLGSPINAYSPMHLNTLSPGRLLGNKTALYKYLNPNMIVVGSTQRDGGESTSSTLRIHLIDTVSGRIIYNVNHKASSGYNGLSVVGSDNWVAYSYWSEKTHRYELSTLELYLKEAAWEKVQFSSFERPEDLLAFKQSYSSVGKANVLSVSKTSLGISSKDLLLGLNDGRLLSMNRKFVDPRRPEQVTETDAAEGLIQYSPNLPLYPQSILNYNITISKLEHIDVYPSKLESTTLVFAYGLDLFFTPYASNMSYDRLSHGFSPIVIAIMIISLATISLFLKGLTDRSELRKAWQ